MGFTIYHNPRCSKSRATLELLRSHGIEPRIVHYLDDPPDGTTLRALLRALGIPARELARRKEAAWQATGLGDDADDEAILAALCRQPVLIERPIVVSDGRAVLGRPPENVLALIGS